MLTRFLSDGLKSFLEMCVEEVFVHEYGPLYEKMSFFKKGVKICKNKGNRVSYFCYLRNIMPETQQNIASTENLADPILTRANGYFDKILKDPSQAKNHDSLGGLLLEDGRIISRE